MPQLSFGIKTSQMGLAYAEIQRVWREADELPVLEHAWLWDHLVPLRGDDHRRRAGGVDAAGRAGRADQPAAARRDRDQQPAPLPRAAGQDGGHGGRHRGRAARARDRRGRQPGSRAEPGGARVRGLRRPAGLARRGDPRPGSGLRGDPAAVDRAERRSATTGRACVLRGAVCEPKPVQRPHPPIMIGGQGDRLLRVVAEHASIWACPRYVGGRVPAARRGAARALRGHRPRQRTRSPARCRPWCGARSRGPRRPPGRCCWS